MKIFRIYTLIILGVLFLHANAVENYPYRTDGLWVTEPNHSDWLYEVGENALVDVSF